jgi:hypothetical protein
MAGWWDPLYAGGACVGGAAAFGYLIESRLDQGFRNRVRDKLLFKSGSEDGWAELFVQMFDSLFKTKKRNRPTFWRSALASVITFTFLAVIWIFVTPDRAATAFEKFTNTNILIGTLWFGILINVFGDFFPCGKAGPSLERFPRPAPSKRRSPICLSIVFSQSRFSL